MKEQLLRLSALLLMLVATVAANAGDNDLTWDYSEAAPSANPDNGLYYDSKVTDAVGTNMGLKGVKLNSSGYAYFEKAAVAGKLTLGIGQRKNANAYEVNVYKGAIIDGKPSKSDLIGVVSVSEGPNTASIDIPADVTGIYIERKTGAEGVLFKVVFKENVARSFVDFEIPYAKMQADGYNGDDLPTGVTFSGTFHDAQHGYGNATLTVPVDGTVKFTISGCRYGGNFDVKNADGTTLATFDQKDAGCFDAGGVITYIYTGPATTLTIGTIAYLAYFKAEATDVQEVTVTFKDQNGKELGTKTLFEGDALGEIPYGENDITIPEGSKFRGWFNAKGKKVKASDIVTSNMAISAKVTPVESVSVGSIQVYDLASEIFYPEDHETCAAEGGSYYNNHGWTFDAGGKFSFDVAGKAQIVLKLCEYGNGTTISITDAAGNVVKSDVVAKADSGSDGAQVSVNYDGEATRLTLTFAAQTYLHAIKVYNVKGFLEKDQASGYYIIPKGDAAAFVLALNVASNEDGAKIFLQDGTYDLGEATCTGISGKNISIIGQSAKNTIITTTPPLSSEGLGTADLLQNTSEGLYMQDLSLKNNFAYGGNDGRAPSLHDMGTKTICKDIFLLSYQDTYYSHKIGGLFYFEGGELHGTVDYLCGNGIVYYNKCTLVNEVRSSATISANSELYVFNNCTVVNNANTYNFGRAWSDTPTCVYLNTTLKDPTKLATTRWNLSGINTDYKVAGEYGTKDADGNDITPAKNEVTFTKKNTTLNTILDASALTTYSIENVLGDWAATAQQQAKQLDAPANAQYANGKVTWTPANNGAIAYMIEKNGEFVGITEGTELSITIDPAQDALTIRAANARGGFGPAAAVAGTVNAVNAVKAVNGSDIIYNMQGIRVSKPGKGIYIIGGKKVLR